MAELEKLGSKFRVALRIVKDARFERLPCMHKGTYADDCLVQRVTQVRTSWVFPHNQIQQVKHVSQSPDCFESRKLHFLGVKDFG